MEKKQEFRNPLSIEDIEKHQKSLDKDFAKHEVMKQDFEGLKAQREQEFSTQIETLLSDEERDIVEVGGNASETYQVLKKHEKIFVDDAVEQEAKIIEEFENKLHENQGKLNAMRIESEYAGEFPDDDFEGLVHFIQNKLTPEQLDALHQESGADQAQFLRLAAKKFSETKTPEIPEDPNNLPTNLNNIAGATGDIDNNDGLSDEDDSYAKQAGLYR
ncbi:MAG: Unknown protein [uncultured Sulfurovum sp.]|uniref:Uncharacterized protein n=1 Tax=uncultured Sulfurovum sp. TaxID=269237 RepID=A0A6S6SUF6_9BACT|nr:MAG: Unknown protein [uncultured Sulfurovum sp.]